MKPDAIAAAPASGNAADTVMLACSACGSKNPTNGSGLVSPGTIKRWLFQEATKKE
jgi:hypothetical protein